MNKFAVISWQLLEYKLAYYHPHLIHDDWKKEVMVEDSVYDKLEDEYKQMCKDLNVEPTASAMVGFDFTRPSCKLVVFKLSNPKKQN